jgi:hypothetical protein
MLLEEVEQSLDLDVNVIEREVKKEKLCVLKYLVDIGELDIAYYKEHPYLYTNTSILINKKPFTTTYSHLLYGENKLIVKNKPLKVMCNNEERSIGYINQFYYLHLPDFVASQVLYKGGNVIAVEHKFILDFFKGEVTVSKHYTEIPSPYYLLHYEFDYNDKADLLAEIIGVFDVYKRGLMPKLNKETLKYFLYPYVSLVLYKTTKTTLYPSIIKTIVSDVINKVQTNALKVLEKYRKDTLSKLEEAMDQFGSSIILY